ncbi:MAG: bifunctional riboflavin kinase/FAD synthetase [Fidelibacterota bacterium]
MEVLTSINDIKQKGNSIVTIGSFDGLHRGHQEIIKKVVSKAQTQNVQSVVITFDPHPRHVLDKGLALPLLMSIDKKLSLLKQIYVDVVLVIPFTKNFSTITPRKFMDDIVVSNFNPNHIIIGYDHHFGFNREGSPDFLKKYCQSKQVTCEIVKAVKDDLIIFSSSHIRQLIWDGFIRRASFELGWVYGFKAIVVKGAGRGRRLSFPTANFVPVEENQLFPKNGVYFCRGRINSNSLYGMCNLGTRPTFDEKNFVAEIHFISQDFNDLYDKEIEIEFLERIRDEIKFDTPEQLVNQLQNDKQYCNELMKKYL